MTIDATAVSASNPRGPSADCSVANSAGFGSRIRLLASQRSTIPRNYRIGREIVVMQPRHRAPERTRRIASDSRSAHGHRCHCCIVEYPVDRIVFRLVRIPSASRLAKRVSPRPQWNSRLPRTLSAHRSTSLCGRAAFTIATIPARIASARWVQAVTTQAKSGFNQSSPRCSSDAGSLSHRPEIGEPDITERCIEK